MAEEARFERLGDKWPWRVRDGQRYGEIAEQSSPI
jgi:hypothetical protein